MTFRNDCHSMNEQYSTFLGWYILCSDKWWWVRLNAFKSPSSEMGMINPINYTTSIAWKMINMWKSDLESFPYRKQPRQKQKEEEREKNCFEKEHISRIPGSEWYLPRPYYTVCHIICFTKSSIAREYSYIFRSQNCNFAIKSIHGQRIDISFIHDDFSKLQHPSMAPLSKGIIFRSSTWP